MGKRWQIHSVGIIVIITILLALLAALLTPTGGRNVGSTSDMGSEVTGSADAFAASAELTEGDAAEPCISISESGSGEAVFSLSADDFISRFNGVYLSSYGSELLTPVDEWLCFTYNSTEYSAHETIYYCFKQNAESHNDPTISLYIPSDGELIQAVTLDFDDHGYTERAYKLFEGYCRTALEVFFPDFGIEEINALYATLFSLTKDEACYIDGDADPVPNIFYHSNGIGLYAYYRAGIAHICIMPATQELLDELKLKSADVYNIETAVR